MSDQLPSLTGLSSPADSDLLYIVDISDTTDGADGTSKKITRQNLLGITGDAVGTDDTQTLTNKTLTSPTITNKTSTGTDSGSETLTNKTLTSPVLNTGVSGTAVLDEDDLSTDSDTQLATQQSIKAYADTYGNNDSMYRQALINGNFDVWQRGTTATDPANGSYNDADRWGYIYTESGTMPTVTTSRQSQTPGALDGSYFFYRINVDGAGSGFASGDSYTLVNKIEHGTRYLCGDGKKVTVSFWAKSSITSKRLGAYLVQVYGNGGSPSAVEVINGDAITLTSSWQKFTHTFTTNTLSGKTFGTDLNDSLQLRLAMMWGADKDVRVGETTAEDFVGAGNIDIAQVQVCAGDTALPFQPKSFEDELRACQRYCYAVTTTNSYQIVASGMGHDTNTAIFAMYPPVTLRSDDPSLTATAGDWKVWRGGTDMGDVTSLAVAATQQGGNCVVLTADVSGTPLTAGDGYFLGSDGTASKIILDAEI